MQEMDENRAPASFIKLSIQRIKKDSMISEIGIGNAVYPTKHRKEHKGLTVSKILLIHWRKENNRTPK
jgi:hypothetical protein